jgi:RimJ/RimL family protein N-acetyltransferase
MLTVSREPLITRRLELRRTRVEDAAAMFEVLRDPEMYAYISRSAPKSVAEIEERFARITQETAPDRADQWLNWIVRLRDAGTPVGMVEATVYPDNVVFVGYIFDPRHHRRGYGFEATNEILRHLSECGAKSFTGTIDIRNIASRALATALGFKHVSTEGLDETWIRERG